MGKITRKEAERQLLSRENEAGMFLIRESETCPGTCWNLDKMSQFMRICYLSHMRAAKAKMSLLICTDLPEPSLLTYAK